MSVIPAIDPANLRQYLEEQVRDPPGRRGRRRWGYRSIGSIARSGYMWTVEELKRVGEREEKILHAAYCIRISPARQNDGGNPSGESLSMGLFVIRMDTLICFISIIL